MKKLIAYLIDMIIIISIPFLINIENKNEINLKKLNEELLDNKITSEEYMDNYYQIFYDIDLDNIGINIITILIIIVNSIVIPSICNQTIGQKIMKLKIINPNKEDLITASVVLYGLGYMVLILFLLLMPPKIYYILVNLLGFLQIIVVITNTFMVLYNKKCLEIFKLRIEEIK